jgi:hypothetical protein
MHDVAQIEIDRPRDNGVGGTELHALGVDATEAFRDLSDRHVNKHAE